VPEGNSRGFSINLLENSEDGSRGNYVDTRGEELFGVRADGTTFGDENDFLRILEREADLSTTALNKEGKVRLVKEGGEITAYHNDNEVMKVKKENVQRDFSGEYRLALRTSGQWGSESKIYFDDVKYLE
jgi:hypothetical protein